MPIRSNIQNKEKMEVQCNRETWYLKIFYRKYDMNLYFYTFIINIIKSKIKILTLRAGFEPARGDPIGFQVQRLNHSAITACI